MGVKVKEKIKGSGVYWIFVNHKGKRKSKMVGSEKAAREAAEKIEAKLTLGEFNMAERDSTPFFKEYGKTWIELPHDWKDSTREDYHSSLEKHLFPYFGKKRLSDISRKDLKLFFNEMYLKGLSLSTLKRIKAPISGILSNAVESELIETNPVRDITLKFKKSSFEIAPLNEPESISLLEQIKTFADGKYYSSVLFALRTGLRIGEIQALKWSDINFQERYVDVKRSWRKGRLTNTKNKRQRRVDLSPMLVEVLKEQRTMQKREALKKGMPITELVFIGTRKGMLNRISFQNALNKCAEAAGLRRIRTHSLRHSYATIRLTRGHNIGDVSYQLGHSSIKITFDVYAHWIPGKFKSEVDELDNAHPDATYAHLKKNKN